MSYHKISEYIKIQVISFKLFFPLDSPLERKKIQPAKFIEAAVYMISLIISQFSLPIRSPPPPFSFL